MMARRPTPNKLFVEYLQRKSDEWIESLGGAGGGWNREPDQQQEMASDVMEKFLQWLEQREKRS